MDCTVLSDTLHVCPVVNWLHCVSHTLCISVLQGERPLADCTILSAQVCPRVSTLTCPYTVRTCASVLQEERPLTDVTVADVIVALNNLASVLQVCCAWSVLTARLSNVGRKQQP
jgi:hypothetical protein